VIYLHIIETLKRPDVYIHGLGFDGFAQFVDKSSDLGGAPPHNVFIKPLIETGVIGFTLFFGFILLTMRRALTQALNSSLYAESINLSIFVAITGVYIIYFFQPLLNPPFFFLLVTLPYQAHRQLVK
jgi:O-antigen ligase